MLLIVINHQDTSLALGCDGRPRQDMALTLYHQFELLHSHQCAHTQAHTQHHMLYIYKYNTSCWYVVCSEKLTVPSIDKTFSEPGCQSSILLPVLYLQLCVFSLSNPQCQTCALMWKCSRTELPLCLLRNSFGTGASSAQSIPCLLRSTSSSQPLQELIFFFLYLIEIRESPSPTDCSTLPTQGGRENSWFTFWMMERMVIIYLLAGCPCDFRSLGAALRRPRRGRWCWPYT